MESGSRCKKRCIGRACGLRTREARHRVPREARHGIARDRGFEHEVQCLQREARGCHVQHDLGAGSAHIVRPRLPSLQEGGRDLHERRGRSRSPRTSSGNTPTMSAAGAGGGEGASAGRLPPTSCVGREHYWFIPPQLAAPLQLARTPDGLRKRPSLLYDGALPERHNTNCSCSKNRTASRAPWTHTIA